MKLRSTTWILVLIGGLVISVVCLMQMFPSLDVSQPLEWKTYDWRVRQAARFAPPVTTNLAAVFFDDDTIGVFKSGSLGFAYGLYWPREVYGYLVRELATQGVRAVGFDIMFGELRPDQDVPVVKQEGTNLVRSLFRSDAFFAKQLRQSGRVILAARQEVAPAELFRTNAWRLGDISAIKDGDGVLRRVKAWTDYRIWHPVIVKFALANAQKMEQAKVTRTGLAFPHQGGANTEVAFDIKNGYFNPSEFAAKFLEDTNLAATLPPRDKLFQEQRVWHMGIVLAARELGLDLDHGRVDYVRRRITLKGRDGLERIIPIDDDGYFFIDWAIKLDDPRLVKDTFEHLVALDIQRQSGETNLGPGLFKDKLVIVGSQATGNDLTDEVVTPLDKKTYGVSQHWNVANSVVTGRFIQPSSLPSNLGIIILLGVMAGWVTWRLRVVWASSLVAATLVAYVGLSLFLYVRFRYLLPIVLPVVGALLMTHVATVTYRVIFEQQERRRVKSVFAKLVSPNVVNELLDAEQLALGGARRKITVYFADVRGFTEMTDVSQSKAEEYVRQNGLTAAAADQYYDDQAREVLATVNLYLSLVADMVKKHNGTLDKYIGDCVMAFWGAPTPNEQHALCCVRAAIDSQRAIEAANLKRHAENQRRELENVERAKNGQPPLPLLALLSLGSGINTGIVTIGLMGSGAHIFNYTAFGREVNLASRLEGVSGRGRIIIGETTYADLQRDDPILAATCIAQPPVKPKGFHEPVKTYEVPWKVAPTPAAATEAPKRTDVVPA